MNTCQSCRFWYRHDDHWDIGSCLRFPPTPVLSPESETGISYLRPHTSGDQTCGEYEAAMIVITETTE